MLERTLDVLYLSFPAGHHYADDIKTHGKFPTCPLEKRERDSAQTILLVAAYCFKRLTVLKRSPRLHFDKHECQTILSDNIGFGPAVTIIAADD